MFTQKHQHYHATQATVSRQTETTDAVNKQYFFTNKHSQQCFRSK